MRRNLRGGPLTLEYESIEHTLSGVKQVRMNRGCSNSRSLYQCDSAKKSRGFQARKLPKLRAGPLQAAAKRMIVGPKPNPSSERLPFLGKIPQR